MPVTMNQVGDEGLHLDIAVFLEAFPLRIGEKRVVAPWIAAICRRYLPS